MTEKTKQTEVVIDLSFEHQFSVEALTSRPAGPAVRIPAAPEEVDSIHLRITPDGQEPWLGSFARGFESDDLISGAYAWPDGVSLAVVAAGYGYVLKPAERGKNWVRLQPNPVTTVNVSKESGLIIFTDFTHMFAYSATRNVWKTERLSWDGITITNVGASHIFGLAWDQTQDTEVEFSVNLKSGEHIGGAKPWAKK
jgi:hypothetical protein